MTSNLNKSNLQNKKINGEKNIINDENFQVYNEDNGLNIDGKMNRKAVFRRTVDYNSSISEMLTQRNFKRKFNHRNLIQPDFLYNHLLTPPQDYKDNAMNCVCTKHIRTSTNKAKSPIHTLCWTPDGRRLITAAGSGEFTLWNGFTFNFETILQAHDTQIKAMKWSHNEQWLLSGGNDGMVKYWQANMNDVHAFQTHKDAVQGLSFCPSDKKFVSCSVDNTLRIWDFMSSKEERVLRGHSGEVKCVEWHHTKAIVLSGSKDNQQPLKLWDPKSGECILTLYAHKNSVNDISVNKNGNWFLSASRDHTMKLFDLRNLKSEMQVFRGHEKEINRVKWHPFHENLFASGGADGTLKYWMASNNTEVDFVNDAHEGSIYSMEWHPMGHIMATGSHDYTTKFWSRSRPGDINENKHVNNNDNKTVEVEFGTTNERANTIDVKPKSLISLIKTEIYKNDNFPVFITPGLIDNQEDQCEINDDSQDEDFQNNDANIKSANKVIPKQFLLNWAEKSKFPGGYISTENTVNNIPPMLLPPLGIAQFQNNIIPINNNMMPINNNMMPINNNMMPINNNMMPINNNMMPINNNMMPINNNMMPINNNMLPNNNNMMPINNNMMPINNNIIPINNNIIPINNNMMPINNNIHLVNNNIHPVNNNMHPVNNNMHPVNNNMHPVNNYMHPVNNNMHPVNNNMHPVNNNMHPVNNNMHPVSNNMHPVNNNMHPVNNDMHPENNMHLINKNKFPVHNNHQHIDDDNNNPQIMLTSNRLNHNIGHNIPHNQNNIESFENDSQYERNLECEGAHDQHVDDDFRDERYFRGPKPIHQQRPQINQPYNGRPAFQRHFQQNNIERRPQFSSQNNFNDNQFHYSQQQRRRSPSNNDFNQRHSRPYNQEDNRQQKPCQMRHSDHLKRDLNHENPFEPQQLTGSSKTFIPLPFNNDGPSNKRPRRGNNW